jgi:hypothetical protein
MGHPGFIGWARPRRQNAQFPIDLHGIGVDHDAAEPLGEYQRKRRLAAAGGARQEKSDRKIRAKPLLWRGYGISHPAYVSCGLRRRLCLQDTLR